MNTSHFYKKKILIYNVINVMMVITCTVAGDITVAGTTDAGGNLGNIADWISKGVEGLAGNINKVVTLGGNFPNDVSNFITDEFINKSDLRGAQFESILGGLPYVGNILKGIEGATQLEDLYNNSGKVPKYPALQGSGGPALGSAIGKLSGKIEDGAHDLFQYYTGQKDELNKK